MATRKDRLMQDCMKDSDRSFLSFVLAVSAILADNHPSSPRLSLSRLANVLHRIANAPEPLPSNDLYLLVYIEFRNKECGTWGNLRAEDKIPLIEQDWPIRAKNMAAIIERHLLVQSKKRIVLYDLVDVLTSSSS